MTLKTWIGCTTLNLWHVNRLVSLHGPSFKASSEMFNRVGVDAMRRPMFADGGHGRIPKCHVRAQCTSSKLSDKMWHPITSKSKSVLEKSQVKGGLFRKHIYSGRQINNARPKKQTLAIQHPTGSNLWKDSVSVCGLYLYNMNHSNG